RFAIELMHPFAEMLGLADALHDSPSFAGCKGLLRQAVVPGMNDKPQCWDRSEIAVQRCWLNRRAKGFGHRCRDRLPVLEVLDELGGCGQVLPDLVRNARLC